MKNNILKIPIFVMILLISTFSVYSELLGVSLDIKESGINIDTGNISIEIYTEATDGILIYNSTDDFIDNITDGKVDITLGSGLIPLNLTYGDSYFMEIFINGNEINFSGEDRKEFTSNLGNISFSNINVSTSIIPDANGTLDLGSSTGYFNNLFVSTLNIIDLITTSQIANNAITSALIAANTILAADIATGAVETTEILDRTITADDIADSTINTTLIAANTILAADIATGAVETTEILDRTITADDIADETINATLLVNNTIIPLNIDSIGWTNLTDYPAACPAGEAVTAVGNTLTCATVTSGNVDAASLLYSNETSNINTSHIVDGTIARVDLGFSVIEGFDNIALTNDSVQFSALNASGDVYLLGDGLIGCSGKLITDSTGNVTCGTDATGGGGSSAFQQGADTIYNDSANIKLGIGTAFPTHTLTVEGDINVTQNITFSDGSRQDTASTNDSRLHAINSSDSSQWIGIRATSVGALLLDINQASIAKTLEDQANISIFNLSIPGSITTNVTFDFGVNISDELNVDFGTFFVDPTSNRVGINTTFPTQSLTVVGDLNVTGQTYFSNLNISGVQFSNGNITTGDSLTADFIYKGSNPSISINNATMTGDLHILGTLYGGSPIQVGSDLNFTEGTKITFSDGSTQSAASTNRSLNYVYNTTDFIGMKGTAAGIVQFDITSLSAEKSVDNFTAEDSILTDFIYPDSNAVIRLKNLTVEQDITTLGNITGLDSLLTDYIFPINNAVIQLLNLTILENVFVTDNLTLGDSILTNYIFPDSNAVVEIENLTIVEDIHVLGNSYLGSLVFEDNGTFPDSVLVDFIFPESNAVVEIENLTIVEDIFITNNISSSDSLLIDYIYGNSGTNIALLGGNVGIGTTSPSHLLNVDGTVNITGGSGLVGLIVDSSADVIVGGTTFNTAIVSSDFAVVGSGTQSIHVEVYSTSNTAPPGLVLLKSASATIGTLAETADGESLGKVFSYGVDTSSIAENAASIEFEQDGAAGGKVPGRILFRTATSSANVATRMLIDSAGNVGIGTTSPGTALEVIGAVNISNGNAVVTPSTGADDLTVSINGDGGMSVMVPDANSGWLIFSSPTTNIVAGIRAQYNSGNEIMSFYTDGSQRVQINATGGIDFDTTGIPGFSAGCTMKLDTNGGIFC